jgi:hypothetical protein
MRRNQSTSFFHKSLTGILVKQLPAFMEPQGSLPCSQKLATELQSVSVQQRPHFHTLFLYYSF